MVRLAYTLALWLALPLVLLRLVWRARLQPDYLSHWSERFGVYDEGPACPVIWLHAVSVGESRAAQPMVEALARRFPGHELVITCMTPTGRASAETLLGARARVVYLPYDYPFAVRRFLGHFRPRLGLIMETEVWPNLMAACAARALPVALINARLSERSCRRYRYSGDLARAAFAAFTLVGAQSAADQARLATLGARASHVTGNVKFDAVPDPAEQARGAGWKAALGGRRVVLAASTREGEEALLLPAMAALVRAGALLVLVPRHPQRFDQVARLAEDAGYKTVRRSQAAPPPDGAEVWLGDSMGEMAAYYALADCAYVGGSLLPFGGQNLIEAAACACPAFCGPHTWNFEEAARAAVTAGAARRVSDSVDLANAMEALLADHEARRNMAAAAIDFAQNHRGAAARTLALIEPLMAKAGS